MKKLACIMLVSLSLLTGCLTVGNSKLTDQSRIDAIIENKTTADEVVALLGQPGSAKTEASGDKIWDYDWALVSGLGVHQRKAINLRIRKGVVIAKDVSGK